MFGSMPPPPNTPPPDLSECNSPQERAEKMWDWMDESSKREAEWVQEQSKQQFAFAVVLVAMLLVAGFIGLIS